MAAVPMPMAPAVATEAAQTRFHCVPAGGLEDLARMLMCSDGEGVREFRLRLGLRSHAEMRGMYQAIDRAGTGQLVYLNASGNSTQHCVSVLPALLPELWGLRHLILRHTGMEKDDLVAVSPAIATLVSLASLDLTGCKISSNEAADVLAALVGKLPSLEKLGLASSALTPTRLEAICPAMTTMQNKLRQLDLADNDLGSSGIKILTDNLLTTLPELRALDLSNTKCGGSGIAAIAGVLASIPHLDRLLLAGNRCGGEGAQALAKALPVLTELQVLNLSRNGIGTEAAIGLLQSLKSAEQLRELILCRNDIMSDMCPHLASLPLTHLRVLKLSGNLLCKPSSVVGEPLAQIGRMGSELKVLDLRDNNLDMRSAYKLFDVILCRPGISVLLAGNKQLFGAPDVWASPPSKVRQWLELQRYPSNRGKLVLLGDAQSGKTSLLNNLLLLDIDTEHIDASDASSPTPASPRSADRRAKARLRLARKEIYMQRLQPEDTTIGVTLHRRNGQRVNVIDQTNNETDDVATMQVPTWRPTRATDGTVYTLSVMDMAGDPVWQPMAVHLVARDAAIILTFNMALPGNDCLEVLRAAHVPQWLDAVAARASGAAVMLVGTHANVSQARRFPLSDWEAAALSLMDLHQDLRYWGGRLHTVDNLGGARCAEPVRRALVELLSANIPVVNEKIVHGYLELAWRLSQLIEPGSPLPVLNQSRMVEQLPTLGLRIGWAGTSSQLAARYFLASGIALPMQCSAARAGEPPALVTNPAWMLALLSTVCNSRLRQHPVCWYGRIARVDLLAVLQAAGFPMQDAHSDAYLTALANYGVLLMNDDARDRQFATIPMLNPELSPKANLADTSCERQPWIERRFVFRGFVPPGVLQGLVLMAQQHQQHLRADSAAGSGVTWTPLRLYQTCAEFMVWATGERVVVTVDQDEIRVRVQRGHGGVALDMLASWLTSVLIAYPGRTVSSTTVATSDQPQMHVNLSDLLQVPRDQADASGPDPNIDRLLTPRERGHMAASSQRDVLPWILHGETAPHSAWTAAIRDTWSPDQSIRLPCGQQPALPPSQFPGWLPPDCYVARRAADIKDAEDEPLEPGSVAFLILAPDTDTLNSLLGWLEPVSTTDGTPPGIRAVRGEYTAYIGAIGDILVAVASADTASEAGRLISAVAAASVLLLDFSAGLRSEHICYGDVVVAEEVVQPDGQLTRAGAPARSLATAFMQHAATWSEIRPWDGQRCDVLPGQVLSASAVTTSPIAGSSMLARLLSDTCRDLGSSSCSSWLVVAPVTEWEQAGKAPRVLTDWGRYAAGALIHHVLQEMRPDQVGPGQSFTSL